MLQISKMPRNHHKALKAKFDSFAVGYGPVVSTILGALRTKLFGEEDHINFVSPVQNWKFLFDKFRTEEEINAEWERLAEIHCAKKAKRKKALNVKRTRNTTSSTK